ncbi:uncharacterized protein LY89DRAFT_734659 [Mollisia scopiformis]|uniref:Uncharacterized protein n=1 Tax=Mollisia scopiformis TaxID=149040 RepID=A0A194X8R0_MOLSC|nr:uncharacterized protein LY89DRAFT_734659 [Mollisia scopiformis]KUJ16561.1 hypothetical protein LY89DRAFT_734659 [Mollisia scopiformis]
MFAAATIAVPAIVAIPRLPGDIEKRLACEEVACSKTVGCAGPAGPDCNPCDFRNGDNGFCKQVVEAFKALWDVGILS